MHVAAEARQRSTSVTLSGVSGHPELLPQDDGLAEGYASVITGKIVMDVYMKPLLRKSSRDPLEEVGVLKDAAAQGDLPESVLSSNCVHYREDRVSDGVVELE